MAEHTGLEQFFSFGPPLGTGQSPQQEGGAGDLGKTFGQPAADQAQGANLQSGVSGGLLDDDKDRTDHALDV